MKRPSLRPGHLGQLLGFAEDLDRLVGDLLAQRREADNAAGTLDQGDAEQGLELAQARGERRLRDKAGVRGPAQMPEAAQRDEILQLLDGRQVDNH